MIYYIKSNMIGKEFKVEADLDKYQKRLNQLYKGRKEIVLNIKELARKQRFMTDKDHSQNKPHSNLAKQPSLQGQQLRQRVSGLSVDELAKSQQSIPQHPHLDTSQEEIKKVVEVQSAIKDRNRRLFGGLNSYLKKAESKLSEESSKVRSKLTIQEKVSQKQREQSQKLQQDKRREMESKLEKLKAAKENNSKEMLITENIILKNKFIAYVSDLQHYLYTSTTPSIAWKPAHTNQTLTQQHHQSSNRLKKTTSETLQQIEAYNQKFDFGKYRLENEKQFYRNYLDNYFRSKLHFIKTTTQPSICWAPALHNSKTRQALSVSHQATADEFIVHQEQNDAFYKRYEKEAAIVDEQQDSQSDH